MLYEVAMLVVWDVDRCLKSDDMADLRLQGPAKLSTTATSALGAHMMAGTSLGRACKAGRTRRTRRGVDAWL